MLNRSLVEMTQQQALQKRMEAIAQNLANTNTTGFRKREITFKEHLNQKPGVEGLSFVQQKGIFYDFTQGGLQVTGSPLDCGLSGPGFFMVQTQNGRFYTRNGHFKLNEKGQIATLTGDLLIDNGGAPIAIPAQTRDVRITSQGDIEADGSLLSRFGLVEFQDLSLLKEIGGGYFQSTETPQAATQTKVIQGSVEGSNVSPIETLTEMINVHRAYERSHNSLRQEEQRVEKTLDTIGRVA